jgi:hypothetical protein
MFIATVPGDGCLVGGVADRIDLGDHVAFVIDVLETQGATAAMGFRQARRIDLRHEA